MDVDYVHMFIQYEYTETKDLIKTFLTLVSGTFVFSIAFSEKIINFTSATKNIRRWLFTSWTCYIAAIILGGICLVLIAAAAGKRVYGQIPFLDLPWDQLALWSWAFGVLAGFSYIAGLGSMAWAARKSILENAPN